MESVNHLDRQEQQSSTSKRPDPRDGTLTLSFSWESLTRRDGFRLLLLHPSKSDTDPLSGHLEHFIHGSSPGYEALSYACGAPALSDTLELDGKVASITRNLAIALRARHTKGNLTYLWVDALCIHQQNNEEKSHQVANMGRIYRGATRVIAWVGELDTDTALALDFLEEIAADSSPFGYFEGWNPFPPVTSTIDPELRQSMEALVDDSRWRKLDSLLARAYFSRLWIMQEVVVSGTVILTCGNRELNWEAFAKSMTVIRSTPVGALTDAFYNVFKVVQGRGRYRIFAETASVDRVPRFVPKPEHGPWRERPYLASDPALQDEDGTAFRPIGPLQLPQLIDNLTEKQCSDDRDRVFALLSMEDKAVAEIISIFPDYSKTVEEVYRELAGRYLGNGHISYLHLAGQHRRPPLHKEEAKVLLAASSNTLNLQAPSWMADYRIRRHSIALGGHGDPIFNASLTRRPTISIPEAQSGRSSPLPLVYVSGNLLDRVFLAVYFFTWDDDGVEFDMWDAGLETGFQALQAIKEQFGLLSRETTYPTGENLTTAFARTLIADNAIPGIIRGLGRDRTPQHIRSLWDLAEKHCFRDEGEYVQALRKYSDAIERRGLVSPEAQLAADYCTSCIGMLNTRCFIFTESGFMGLAPNITKQGDRVSVFDGAETPFILRPVECITMETSEGEVEIELEDTYQVVGECYIHGLMDEEVWKPDYADRGFTHEERILLL